jgi:hypothetical protein
MGLANQFVVRKDRKRSASLAGERLILLRKITYGSLAIYTISVISGSATFFYSNTQDFSGSDMSVPQLQAIIGVALSLLAVTSTITIAALFESEDEAR